MLAPAWYDCKTSSSRREVVKITTGKLRSVSRDRLLDEVTRDRWRKDLEQSATRSLDAPSWLWSSVVDLIGIHERAYLEHCRRFALRDEKAREERVADGGR